MKKWAIALAIALGVILFSYAINRFTINSYEDCVAAGYPIMESYPEQCSNGINTWTRNISIGGDKDSHGCLIAAGYSWCESKQKCLRIWEEGCGNCEINSDCQAYGKDGECNCGCYNTEMMPTISGGDCFCAAPTSCECVSGKCQGVFE